MNFITPNMGSRYQSFSQFEDFEAKQLFDTLSVIRKNLKNANYSDEIIGATEIAFLFKTKLALENELLKKYSGDHENKEYIKKVLKIGFPFYSVMRKLIDFPEFSAGIEYLIEQMKKLGIFIDNESSRISQTKAFFNAFSESLADIFFENEDIGMNYYVDSKKQRHYLEKVLGLKSNGGGTQNKNNAQGAQKTVLTRDEVENMLNEEYQKDLDKLTTPDYRIFREHLSNGDLKNIVNNPDGIFYNYYHDQITNPDYKLPVNGQELFRVLKLYYEVYLIYYKDCIIEGFNDQSPSSNLIQNLQNDNNNNNDSGDGARMSQKCRLIVMSKLLDYDVDVNGTNDDLRIEKSFDAAYQSALFQPGDITDDEKELLPKNYLGLAICKSILFPLVYASKNFPKETYVRMPAAFEDVKKEDADTLDKFCNKIQKIFDEVIPLNLDFVESLNNDKNNNTLGFDELKKQFDKGYMYIKSFDAILKDIGDNDSKMGFYSNEIGVLVKKILRAKVEKLRRNSDKILSIMTNKDKSLARNFKRSYLYDDDYSSEPYYYGDLSSLIDDFKKSAEKYKKFENETNNESFLLNDDNEKDNFFKNKASIYYRLMYGYFNKAAEYFEEYNKYANEEKNNNNDSSVWRDKSVKLRDLKVKYGALVLNLFKHMVSVKLSTESKLTEMLKSLKVNIDMEKFNDAYDSYIRAIFRSQRMNDISDLMQFCRPIGKDLENWRYFNGKFSDKIEGSGIKASLDRLNAMIFSIVNQLQESQKVQLFGNPYKQLTNMIKECAVRDLMTIKTLKDLTRPLNNVLNFDFFRGKSIERKKDRVKIDLDSFKEGKLVGEKLLGFIKSYMKVDIGYTTYRDRYYYNDSFFLNMRDYNLKSKVSSLQNLMEKYEELLKNRNEQIVGEESKDKDEEDAEASTDDSDDEKEEIKEEPKTPVEKEIVEKLNSEGYIVPLMFHDNASITNCDCEYQILPNNQGVQIKLLNCPDVNTRPVIAVPIVNNSTMNPVTLNAGVGTIPNLAVGSNTQIHFYYEAIDANKFIGASRIHGLKELKDAKNLSVTYVEKNLDNDKDKTNISDYGDKIIVQLPKSFYPKNVVFVTCNQANNPNADKYKHNIVCTKDGRYILVIEDAELLKSLGNEFELHMYTNNISGGTYITKLMINRDSSSSGENDASKFDEKDAKSKGKKDLSEDLADEEIDSEKGESSKKGKKSKKKEKKKNKEKKLDLENEDEEEEKKKELEKKPKLTLINYDDDLDFTDDEDSDLSDSYYDLFD